MLFQRLLKRRNPPGETNGGSQTAADLSVKTDPDQGRLIEQALRHGDLDRRLEAIHQLADLETLVSLAADPEAVVRAAALERLLSCLCQPHGPLPQGWQSAIAPLQGVELARLARSGHSPEVRRAAIECVSDAETLAACAVQDPSPANRLLAVERIEDKAALDAVVRGIGKKDKRVYRRAREKLRLLAERAERPRIVRERCAELCAQAERLGRLGQWSQDRALLDYLERQWAALQDEAEAEWRECFERERARFLAAYAAYLESQTKRAEPPVSTAEQGAPELPQEDPAATAPADEEMPASAAAPSPEPLSEGPSAETPKAAVTPEARPSLESLVKINARIEQLLQASRPLDYKQAQRLLERGRARAAHWPDSEAAQVFASHAERLERRLRNQRKHAEQRLRQFPDRLADLEAHLEEGELKKADPLYQSLLAALELIRASGLESEAISEFDRRLRLLAPHLRELQNWRRWGADQHREALCVEMESLIDQEIPLERLAERLHRLQMDWKRIDRTGAPANQALWERFHAASERVYARCRPFMEAQAAEREANRLARERICEQIEDFLAKVDWERVDWKKVHRLARELRQTWAALGPTEGRVRRPLERRFHRSLRVLEQHLDAERERNLAFKRELIARAQALSEHPDLHEAIAQTKALQRQWQTTVPGRQREENRLWNAFRTACDAVFARRTAQQQAQSAEQAKHLAVLESICAEAERLVASEQDPRRLAAAQRELAARWREAESLPLPRQAAAAIHRRWQSCRQALEHQRQLLERRQRHAEIERLAAQAALCERIEQGLLAGDDSGLDGDGLRQDWAGLAAPQDPKLAQALSERFERALAALVDPAVRAELIQKASANAQRRAELCLRLEIAAGVETPPEFAEQRLKLQVARLAERLAERETGPKPRGLDLLVDWYLLGPAPRDEVLEQRFERAKAALLAEHAQ